MFLSSGITWGCANGVAFLIAPIFIFDAFVFMGTPVETLLGRKKLLGAPVGVPLGMPPQLSSSEVLHGCL